MSAVQAPGQPLVIQVQTEKQTGFFTKAARVALLTGIVAGVGYVGYHYGADIAAGKAGELFADFVERLAGLDDAQRNQVLQSMRAGTQIDGKVASAGTRIYRGVVQLFTGHVVTPASAFAEAVRNATNVEMPTIPGAADVKAGLSGVATAVTGAAYMLIAGSAFWSAKQAAGATHALVNSPLLGSLLTPAGVAAANKA